MPKYSKVTLEQTEAVWNKFGGEEGVNRFLRGELSVSKPNRSWYEENGAIHFEVTSNSWTGGEWIAWFENKGVPVSNYAKWVLRSPGFVPTNGLKKVAILKGNFFRDKYRTTKNILAEAIKRKFSTPNAELICLICKKLTNEEIKDMGLRRIVAMHEPINYSDGVPLLLETNYYGDGCWLDAYYDWSNFSYLSGNRDSGFAFVVSSTLNV